MLRKNIFITGGIALAFGILIGILFTANFNLIAKANATEIIPDKAPPSLENLIPQKASLADVVDKARPYVVSITSTRIIRFRRRSMSPYDNPMFREFFGFQPPSRSDYGEFEERGLGSGVIVNEDGYIMTNAHVVDQADEIIVHIDEKKYEATVVGLDQRSDIAILKIDTEGKDLVCAKIGDSDAIRVGDWVIAIGNPFELEHTVTAGIISAKGRSNVGIVDYENFLQTDASINPGNSGGALVDLDGRLIGINTAIASRNGSFQGIGFAIPVNMAVKVMEQLIEKGFVDRGYMGVTLQKINEDLAEALDLDNTNGVLINYVMNDSPAKEAGLENGDVIIKLDNKHVNTVEEIRNEVALTAPGTEMKITIIRNGKVKDINLILTSLSDIDGSANMRTNAELPIDKSLRVEPLTPELKQARNIDSSQEGVIIMNMDPESDFARAGILEGDIILEMNRIPIRNIGDYNYAASTVQVGRTVLLLIQRQSHIFYKAVRITE